MSNLQKFKDVNGNLLFKNQEEASAAYKKDPTNFIKVTIMSYNQYTPGIETVNLNGTTKKMLFHKFLLTWDFFRSHANTRQPPKVI